MPDAKGVNNMLNIKVDLENQDIQITLTRLYSNEIRILIQQQNRKEYTTHRILITSITEV